MRYFMILILFVVACLANSAAARDDAGSNGDAKSAYKTNCIACHGADGAGTSVGKSMKVPNLRSEEVQKKSDADLGGSITEGKNNMPSFKRSLSPEQVQALVAYIREFAKAKPASGK
jgi:mono/diheme cytochrome c family protein